MTESELCSFQVICMNGGSLADQCRVSKICHDKEIAFYASENSGYYGMIFADLNGHTYVSVKQGGNIDTSKPPVKLACPSLNDFMMSSHAASWGKIHRSLRWGLSDQILAMLVLKMWMSNSTNVDSGDQNKFHQYALQLLHSKGFSDTEDKNLITKTLKLVQTLLSCTNADVTPVCAVLGGFLAQDIVKVVSTHNEPICNIFTFDGTTGEGRITKAMIV
jgi:ubiquitin-like 1-activating enzyme E1 A